RITTMPKEVKQKRNTSAEAAAREGLSAGSVSSRKRLSGEAPSVAAASQRRGSSLLQAAPTTRATTATLKNTCASRIGTTPRSRPEGSSARKAVATTTVGSTNGT